MVDREPGLEGGHDADDLLAVDLERTADGPIAAGLEANEPVGGHGLHKLPAARRDARGVGSAEVLCAEAGDVRSLGHSAEVV